MLYVVLGTLALIAGILAVLNARRAPSTLPVPAGAARPNDLPGLLRSLMSTSFGDFLLIAAGLGMLASTSFVFIDGDRVGHLRRVYG